MVTIQWLVYMVVVCCACLGVLFLLFSFMAKQVAKQKEKITFVRSLISLIAESLKKSNHSIVSFSVISDERNDLVNQNKLVSYWT